MERECQKVKLINKNATAYPITSFSGDTEKQCIAMSYLLTLSFLQDARNCLKLGLNYSVHNLRIKKNWWSGLRDTRENDIID